MTAQAVNQVFGIPKNDEQQTAEQLSYQQGKLKTKPLITSFSFQFITGRFYWFSSFKNHCTHTAE